MKKIINRLKEWWKWKSFWKTIRISNEFDLSEKQILRKGDWIEAVPKLDSPYRCGYLVEAATNFLYTQILLDTGECVDTLNYNIKHK